jgi:hypothetical protein
MRASPGGKTPGGLFWVISAQGVAEAAEVRDE